MRRHTLPALLGEKRQRGQAVAQGVAAGARRTGGAARADARWAERLTIAAARPDATAAISRAPATEMHQHQG